LITFLKKVNLYKGDSKDAIIVNIEPANPPRDAKIDTIVLGMT